MLQPFMKYHSLPLFSVTQHNKKHWDAPTPGNNPLHPPPMPDLINEEPFYGADNVRNSKLIRHVHKVIIKFKSLKYWNWLVGKP